jgi:hypothetical protein
MATICCNGRDEDLAGCPASRRGANGCAGAVADCRDRHLQRRLDDLARRKMVRPGVGSGDLGLHVAARSRLEGGRLCGPQADTSAPRLRIHRRQWLGDRALLYVGIAVTAVALVTVGFSHLNAWPGGGGLRSPRRRALAAGAARIGAWALPVIWIVGMVALGDGDSDTDTQNERHPGGEVAFQRQETRYYEFVYRTSQKADAKALIAAADSICEAVALALQCPPLDIRIVADLGGESREGRSWGCALDEDQDSARACFGGQRSAGGPRPRDGARVCGKTEQGCHGEALGFNQVCARRTGDVCGTPTLSGRS